MRWRLEFARHGAGMTPRVVMLAGVAALLWPCSPSRAEQPGYTIAVFISHDKATAAGPATGPEEVDAIRDFVSRRVAILNKAGGIAGRPIEARFYDDFSEGAKTVENVDAALANPNLIAMIGIWNSSRGSLVVDRIGQSGVPLISEMSVETLFEKYPNVYTLTRSVRDEQEVFRNFAADRYKRIAFVGAEDDLYTRDYHGHLAKLTAPASIVSTFWLNGNVDDQLETVDQAIAGMREAAPDFLFLSIGSKRGASFLKRLTAAGFEPPLFVALGSINGMMADPAGKAYGGAMYEIAEGGIANLNNERLEQLMRQPQALSTRPFGSYAVGYGARYADLAAMVTEAAREGITPAPGKEVLPADLEPEKIRAAIGRELASFAEGRRVWRGWAQDWAFTKERASAERSLLVWRPEKHDTSMLAPIQYVRAGGAISRVPVLYVHLQMVRIYRVDSNDKSFDADFYFTTRSEEEVPISAIEFTNAYRGQGSALPLINIREVHRDEVTGTTAKTRVFKVSGRFLFEPDLRKYPFDEQVFSISFQPQKTSSLFLIQPPAEEVRRQDFHVDGWRVYSHYVGTKELIISSIFGALSEERVIPYYNFNYTWVMKRTVIDYLLRVIVPLSFIMIVAYLAIFIPRSEFNAIIAIQVTALLSSIALYLALNQPSADDATLSDQIFVVAYATISVMIALSIFEVNTTLMKSGAFLTVVHVAQVYLVPIVALGLIAYVIFEASSDFGLGQTLTRVLRPTG